MPRVEQSDHRPPGEAEDTAAIRAALEAVTLGFRVVPLAPGRKVPLFVNAHQGEKPEAGRAKCTGQCGQVGHGAHDGTTDPNKIRQWFRDEPRAGLGGGMGVLIGIDIDFQHGGRLLNTFPATRTHYSGRGNGNRHLIYAYEPGSVASKISQRNGWLPGVDVKAGPGAYLVLPPTLHETSKKPYTVGDENGGVIHVLTDDEVRAIGAEAGVGLPGLAQKREVPAGGSPPPSRDLFAASGHREPSKVLDALRNPPARGQGVTNEWLATVAGHYARAHRENRDFYDVEVRRAIAMVDAHYEDASKTIDSIWDKEHSKEGERAWAVAQRVEAKLVEHEAKAAFSRALSELDPAPPFDLGTLEDVLARPKQEQFRIQGLMLADGFTSIVAQRKTGKTTFNLNMADAMLTGRDFLGRFPVTPVDGTIAILNYEVSGHQLGLWADKVGVDRKRLILVNLRGRRNPLSHEQDRAELVAKLRGYDVESMFVDPFSRAFYGESQQDNTQVQAFLNDLDVFARSEVGVRDVVLNVHAGWNGNRSRGASALEDHPDSIVWLRKNEDDTENGPRYLSALGRDVDVDEDQLAFDASTQRLSLTGLGSRQQAKREQKTADLEAPILAVVRQDPGANTTTIEKRLREQQVRFQNGDVNRALQVMSDAALVRREKGQYGAIRNYPAGETLTIASGKARDDF